MLLLLLATLVMVVGGGAAIAVAIPRPAAHARLLGLSRTPIADAGEGVDIRIEGTVEVYEGTIEARRSRTRCVYCEDAIDEHGEDGWVVAETRRRSGRDGVPFVVRDDTGHVIVDPEGAATSLNVDDERTVGAGSVLRRRLVASERLIVPGDTLIVIGRGVREPDPDPGHVTGAYRDAPTRLRFSHSPAAPLHLVDPSWLMALRPARRGLLRRLR